MSDRILFIDDEFSRFLAFQEQNPGTEIFWAQCTDAARQIFEAFGGQFAFIFFDHDLGVRPDPGEDFPDFLTIRDFISFLGHPLMNNRDLLAGSRLVVHSSNPAGAAWLESILKELSPTPELVFRDREAFSKYRKDI